MMKVYDIIKNNGATLNKNGREVNYLRGFQVSIKDFDIIKIDDFDDIILNFYLRLINENEYLGIWIDNGFVYIDKSKYINSKKRLLTLEQ